MLCSFDAPDGWLLILSHTGDLIMGNSYLQDTARILEISIRLDFRLILAVFFTLVLFGLLFNQLVAWLERKGYAEGFMGLLVGLGVFFTLLGVALISVPAALITLVAFCGSGIPMIVGSMIRYARKRERVQSLIKRSVGMDGE
jgi:hypothetical protein